MDSKEIKSNVFFLGGKDAEMIEIKNILETNKCEIAPHKSTKWGAKLSDYKDFLKSLPENKIPVFIELILDKKELIPNESIIIDHHNENAGWDKKTSIEQIADLLKITLSREQKIISANDKDMFNGMKAFGATDEEIKKVNEIENEAQEITPGHNQLAARSIKHFSTVIDDDIIIINSLTNKTRPVLELLYNFEYECFKYNHIFILYEDKSLNYTGTGEIISSLINKYSELKKTEESINYWWGGILPIRGYFGSDKILTKDEIIELVKRPIISHHIFLLPFLIENDNNTGKDHIEEIIRKINNNNGWELNKFKISNDIEGTDPIDKKPLFSLEDIWNYNEYNYFYYFVRDTLYRTNNTNSADSVYFDKKINPKDTNEFIISVRDDYQTKNYNLTIDNISLRIFKHGIGVLALTLYNYNYRNKEDILKINDFGRRIYPQFMGRKGTENTMGVLLPCKLTCTVNNETVGEDLFKTEDYLKKSKTDNYAAYIKELIKPIDNIRLIIDDRMYTICWYGNNEQINNLKNKTNTYEYENNRFWYMFAFIDGKFAGIGNDEMRRKLIKDVTYPRFIDDGTLYAVTRYSFVCLSGRNDFTYPLIRNHMQKMYYQMAVLLLVQRASILYFEKKVKDLTNKIYEILKERNCEGYADDYFDNLIDNLKKIELLNLQIIDFKNEIAFDEITPQEQGIEIYQIAQMNMDITKHLKELGEKMSRLHMTIDQIMERKNLVQDNEKKSFINKITLIGIMFIPVTFILSIINVFKPAFKQPSWVQIYPVVPGYDSYIFFGLLFFVITLLLYCLVNDSFRMERDFKANWYSPLKAIWQQYTYWKKNKKNEKNDLKWWKVFLLAYTLFLIFYSLLFFCKYHLIRLFI